MADIFGLGIETSCDETSAAVVRNGSEVFSAPIFSQVALHKKYGGVVPEIASRAHLEKLPYLIQKTLKRIQKIDYVAVTVQPGLIGSLLVGYNAALGFSLDKNIPLIPIHHLKAHLYAVLLSNKKINYPFLGLLLSGGNSAIYKCGSLNNMNIIGDTLDDACGEALDKAAQLLGLPYPGGPYIEKAADEFFKDELSKGILEKDVEKQNPFPEILKDQPKDDLNFSFSGIKTALNHLLKANKTEFTIPEIAHHFQTRLIQLILRNIRKACLKYDIRELILAGGVAANQTLRKALSKMASQLKIRLIYPEIQYCTDNAAMVACLGFLYFRRGSWPDIHRVSSSKDLF